MEDKTDCFKLVFKFFPVVPSCKKCWNKRKEYYVDQIKKFLLNRNPDVPKKIEFWCFDEGDIKVDSIHLMEIKKLIKKNFSDVKELELIFTKQPSNEVIKV
jgi:hypothetical protein